MKSQTTPGRLINNTSGNFYLLLIAFVDTNNLKKVSPVLESLYTFIDWNVYQNIEQKIKMTGFGLRQKEI